MKALTRTTAPEEFIGGYGPAWKRGLLSEHLTSFTEAGGLVRTSASGSGAAWALVPHGKALEAIPVVCSEIIALSTEDGMVTGRCGQVATRDGSCEGHAVERESWMAMSDAEVAHWERQREGAF